MKLEGEILIIIPLDYKLELILEYLPGTGTFSPTTHPQFHDILIGDRASRQRTISSGKRGRKDIKIKNYKL